MVNIILIGGRSNSGKGSVATILNKSLSQISNNNIIQCSLSTYIRQITKDDFYWDGVDTPDVRYFMAEVYRLASKLIYPYHMARRVWERDIIPNIKDNKNNIAIVESFREKINYDYFKILQKEYKIYNIVTLNVVRPEYDVAGNILKDHQSEADLKDFNFNYVIYNDGSVKDLEEKVNGLIRCDI